MLDLPSNIKEMIIMYAHPTLPDDLKYEIQNFEFEEPPVELNYNEFISFIEYAMTQQMSMTVSIELNDEVIEFNF